MESQFHKCIYFKKLPDVGCVYKRASMAADGSVSLTSIEKLECGVIATSQFVQSFDGYIMQSSIEGANTTGNVVKYRCSGYGLCDEMGPKFPMPADLNAPLFRYQSLASSYIVEVEVKDGDVECKGHVPSYPAGTGGKL